MSPNVDPVPSTAGATQDHNVEAQISRAISNLDASKVMVNNLGQLRELAPELYKLTIDGVMMQIISKSRRHTEELRRIIKEGEENNRRR